MTPSALCLDLIKEFEGFRAAPYLCPGGFLTIGYGHVMQNGEEFASLTPDAAYTLLCQDVGKAAQVVKRLIAVPLTQNQFDALVSFTFNVGAGALQRSTLRRCINRGDHSRVPQELMKWTKVGGRVVSGLVRRRRVEGKMYVRLFNLYNLPPKTGIEL